MARAAFQVLIIPYRREAGGEPLYLLLRRADSDAWQWIAGGGEDQETPDEAAKREATEEAGVSATANLLRLDSVASIPAIHFADRHLWGEKVYVIPEYSFAVEAASEEISLSGEHSECRWANYETALAMLKWDSNKTALWELHTRLSAQCS